jgi:hypothetical protein
MPGRLPVPHWRLDPNNVSREGAIVIIMRNVATRFRRFSALREQ